MKLLDIFRDDNDINEKSVLGFLSFAILAGYGVIDIITGLDGKQFVIEPIILEVFAALTAGCFGISSFEKVQNRKTDADRDKALLGADTHPLPEDEG
jgi:hypothetical protein